MTTATTETESPKPVRLDKSNVTKALKDAVKARGADYVYGDHFGEQCEYVRDQKPACLVGEVLATSFHIPIDVLSELETTADDVLYILRAEGLLVYTAEAQEMLTTAQGLQDTGTPWGEAVKLAVTPL